MAEHLYGSACHYCGQVIAMPVDVVDVYDAMGAWHDVSVEVDMDPWWAHINAHREAGDAPRAEGLFDTRMPGAH